MSLPLNHKIHLAGTVTVGPKGQVVIPAEVRESMGIGPGEKLVAFFMPDRKSITFITEETAQDMVNKLGEKVSLFRDSFQKGK